MQLRNQSAVQHGELREHRQLQQQDQPWCESFHESSGGAQQMSVRVKESVHFRHLRHDRTKQLCEHHH